jgi:hypothetical protein
MAVPIVNVGDSPAASVQVSSLSFGNGSRAKPVSLPISAGEIVSGSRAVLQTRFTSLATPGSYLLAVSGTYTFQGTSHPFNAQRQVAVAHSVSGPGTPSQVIVPKNSTTGVPIPASPISQEDDNNAAGPPIPDGPVIHPFPVPPSSTGTASPSGGSSVTFIRDTGTGQSGNFPPDPNTAAGASGDGVVLSSGNSYVLFSKDDGLTFTRIDPTTMGFPLSDGGLCCDQVILYNSRVNLFFWLMQYKSPPSALGATTPGANRLRIAWATPAGMKVKH